MIKIKNSIQFIVIVILGIAGVIISALILTNFFRALGFADSRAGMILLTWGAMLIGFGIIPTGILKKKYSITKADVGIGHISKNEIILCLSVIVITILYIVVSRSIFNITFFIIALLQNIGVAVFEEYFTKGILFFAVSKITKKKVIVLLVCSCVFALGLHSSGDVTTNLIYRLPMAIVLGICYLKTNNLYLPITLHLVNNLLATSLLQ